MSNFSNQLFENLAVAVAILSVVAAIYSAFRSGVVKAIRFGSIAIEGAIKKEDIEKAKAADNQPFEITALASYYNQALSRAQISFWFSLIFASIGFGVIIMAFASHDSADMAGSILKIVSGTIIDAVAALFFVQSTNAQKSMSEFFEKLRHDRLNAEAREMVAEIEEAEARDRVRIEMIGKYTGIAFANDA
ncbi:hypothetical protein PhaeoP72_02044 [Phaeobacter inhibens]|uniref:TRADD-N-associated membrane domain-containing protein n=1 Tax=Phaeobacter inhibens TaxID=221822 RepID=UPI000C9C460C|nr:hypothetical protein [Phaeobacter inhibens]AUR04011.1 hypothetical protein PhaeoP72_02044 [Phaeobacter inhibens]UWR74825.1 hypothetical protein K4L04_10040 [Phaeobacter inhibens]